MNITSEIKQIAIKPERLTLEHVLNVPGVYHLCGGCSHDKDFVITTKYSGDKYSLYFNGVGNALIPLNVSYYKANKQYYFTKSNKQITLTFSN